MTPRISLYEERRGQPKGKFNLDSKALKSIVLIASKYNVDPKRLVDASSEAWGNGISHYRSLQISCRATDQDRVTFLITKDSKVVSQFPIKLEILKNPEYLKNRIESIPLPRYSRRTIDQKEKKINELRYGMKKIDVKATITEVPLKKAVYTRWGSQSYVSNVLIGDETGSIRLSLWNNQINQVHVGDEVEIKNGYVASFAGASQLRLGRKGELLVIAS